MQTSLFIIAPTSHASFSLHGQMFVLHATDGSEPEYQQRQMFVACCLQKRRAFSFKRWTWSVVVVFLFF